MIVKSLSRKSGGTNQLFNYLFRYMLNEEKREAMPEHLASLVKKANTYKTARAFEKALQEQELLQYHGTPVDFAGKPNMVSSNYGNLGNGFYLAKNAAFAKKYTQHTGVVKKYVLDPKAKFFNAGKGHTQYGKLWEKTSKKYTEFTSLTELHDNIREYLKEQGYAGIKAEKQTIVFDDKAITELPKYFFKQAKRYSAKEKIAAAVPKQPQFVVRHNIRSRTIPGYIKEFERNEALRIHKRKDSVQVYHTILSFSNKDKDQINEAVLRDMAKKYIELRGKDNLYVITAHHDKDHIHMHCAMAGTKLSGLSARVSRTEFANIKKELDAYQREKYPQLAHSLPRHGKAKQIEAREELKNIKRNERTIDKNSILKVLDETYSKATSQEQFLDSLNKLGHVPYYRAGKLTGITYNGERKFRLNRLGFDEKKLLALSTKAKEETALQEIHELRNAWQREPVQQTLPFEEKIKGMNEEDQRKELQALVNTSREFERKYGIPDTASVSSKNETAVQELQNIRESKSKQIDKNDSHNAPGRDRVDDGNEPDDKDDSDSNNDSDGNDKNAGSTDYNNDANDDPVYNS